MYFYAFNVSWLTCVECSVYVGKCLHPHFVVLCSRQSQSPAWVGGFGTQPSQAQPGPVMNQANFGMAGYQTQ